MANLNEILQIAGNLEKAEEMARMLVAQDEQFLLDLQLILSARGKIEESENLITFLSTKHPNDNRIAFNKGWHLLRHGDLQKGMEMLDRGRVVNVFGSPKLSGKPLWKGDNPQGKIILLRGEGGLGDEIINVRFAADIAKQGGRVLVSCHPSLQTLFARVSGVSEVVVHSDLTEDMFDEWVPAMSAARVCGHTFDTLSGRPYVTPLPAMVEKWKEMIYASAGVLKVGIRWSGSSAFEHEQFRKFPPEYMIRLMYTPQVKLFSLQRDEDLRQLPPEIADWSGLLETWEDTAGAIANVDLVITSCTSVAHLAGAMGKETWVIVPIMPYYIWALPGEKSPWYDTVRIFRQTQEGDWREPFSHIETALIKRVEDKGNRLVKNLWSDKKSDSDTLVIFGLPHSGQDIVASLLSQNSDMQYVSGSGNFLGTFSKGNAKMIVTVRPVTDVLTACIKAEKGSMERSVITTQCQTLTKEEGSIGRAYDFIHDTVLSGMKDHLLFINYDMLIRNPKRELKRIYEFLGKPEFEHDLGVVNRLSEVNDPMAVLGPQLVGRYARVEPWEQWV